MQRNRVLAGRWTGGSDGRNHTGHLNFLKSEGWWSPAIDYPPDC